MLKNTFFRWTFVQAFQKYFYLYQSTSTLPNWSQKMNIHSGVGKYSYVCFSTSNRFISSKPSFKIYSNHHAKMNLMDFYVLRGNHSSRLPLNPALPGVPIWPRFLFFLFFYLTSGYGSKSRSDPTPPPLPRKPLVVARRVRRLSKELVELSPEST